MAASGSCPGKLVDVAGNSADAVRRVSLSEKTNGAALPGGDKEIELQKRCGIPRQQLLRHNAALARQAPP